MQLRKRARRLAPTYDKINFPSGTRRQDSDFNQERNTHPTNASSPRKYPKPCTPREMFALDCARDTPRGIDGRAIGPREKRGKLPTIREYNALVNAGRMGLRGPMSAKRGTNW